MTKHAGIVRAADYFKKAVHGRDTANYKVVRKGDLAYATIHLDEGSIGVLEQAPAGIVSPMYTVFRPTEAIDARYLFWTLKLPESLGVYRRLAEGTVNRRASIGFDTLGALHLLHPPLGEQRKIAAILSSVDDAIEAMQAVIDQLQLVKKAMMAELLTRGLPGRHTRFEQTEIGKVPEEWDVVPLESLADRARSSLTNGPFGSDLLTSELVAAGVPVVYIRDIRDGVYRRRSEVCVTEQKAEQLAFCSVRSGDLLVAKVGDPPGVAAIYPGGQPNGIVTQDVIRLRPDVARIAPGFLWAYLNSAAGIEQIDDIAVEGTRKRVSLREYRQLPVPLPPLDEQRRIAQTVLSIDSRIQDEEAVLTGVRAGKSALMSVLLTGEVRVTPDEAAA